MTSDQQGSSKDQSKPPRDGFVFAATRPRHRILARKAARALRLVSPDAKIDLFTDEPLEDDVFDQVHLLERTWHRPKIEALRRSRFERTVCLDNDVIAICDASDLFDLLGKAEVVAAHDNSRNSTNALAVAGGPVPASFPSLNSGVLGIRRTPATQELLHDWEQRIKDHRNKVDQPSLRSLLWERDLQLCVVPIEYNLMLHGSLAAATRTTTAPRFIHMREMNKNGRDPGDPNEPHRIADYYTAYYRWKLRFLKANDATLGRGKRRPGPRAQTLFTMRHFALYIRILRLPIVLDALRSKVAGRKAKK